MFLLIKKIKVNNNIYTVPT